MDDCGFSAGVEWGSGGIAAGGVEGALPLLRAVVNERATVFVDHITEKLVSSLLSQRTGVIEVSDDLPAHQPKVAHMPANGLRGKSRRRQVLNEGRKQANSASPGGKSFSSPIQECGQLSRSRQ
jgi:hypothetical protein